ncbi:MAG: hypothetical protein ACK528_14215, partial [Alphaproteobacteria bacterium]
LGLPGGGVCARGSRVLIDEEAWLLRNLTCNEKNKITFLFEQGFFLRETNFLRRSSVGDFYSARSLRPLI